MEQANMISLASEIKKWWEENLWNTEKELYFIKQLKLSKVLNGDKRKKT